MPIYEYSCGACNRTTEQLQRLDEPPLASCPHCGGELKKLISAPAFQFKGSGWYVTDYARKDVGSKEPSASPAEGGKTEKSESAPASAGESTSAPAPPAKSTKE